MGEMWRFMICVTVSETIDLAVHAQSRDLSPVYRDSIKHMLRISFALCLDCTCNFVKIPWRLRVVNSTVLGKRKSSARRDFRGKISERQYWKSGCQDIPEM